MANGIGSAGWSAKKKKANQDAVNAKAKAVWVAEQCKHIAAWSMNEKKAGAKRYLELQKEKEKEFDDNHDNGVMPVKAAESGGAIDMKPVLAAVAEANKKALVSSEEKSKKALDAANESNKKVIAALEARIKKLEK